MMHWQEQWVAVDGARLYCHRGRHPQGDGRPVLVFLHEALGSVAQWKGFPGLLAEQCGCHALVYERRGHGHSDPLELPRRNDYLQHEGLVVLPALLEALGLAQVVLVGHSDGGSIALLGASAMPERVAGVITEAAHVFVEPETRDGIWEAVDLYPTRLRERLARYHGEKTDDLFRAWHQTWLRGDFQGLDLTPWLGDIRCPALIAQGRGDQYGSQAQVEAICAGIGPAARALWLEAAHCPHFEAQEACLAAMTAFVRRLLSPAPRSAATA